MLTLVILLAAPGFEDVPLSAPLPGPGLNEPLPDPRPPQPTPDENHELVARPLPRGNDDHSHGGRRFGWSLLGSLIAASFSPLLAGVGFVVGWVYDTAGGKPGLSGGLALGAVVGVAAAVFLTMAGARTGHESEGGYGTFGAASLGFCIGATLAFLLVVPALGYLSREPVLSGLLLAAAAPMPLFGTTFGLEIKHRARVGFGF